MKRTIQVYLGDDARRVGTLHFDAVGARQHSAFAYENSWLKASNRFALENAQTLRSGGSVSSDFHRIRKPQTLVE